MNMWLKKAFHKFIINENGAVSIYAIMITLLLFIFNAVLIDYVRIMAAERKVDQAVKAAARSTMSSFDKSMMGSYGLFGFKGDEANIFEQVVREHLQTGEDGYFKFAEAQYVDGSASVTFNPDMMVASKDTFEYQILEDMKYKAPLEIGESILEGFLSVSNEMETASNFVDVAAQVQKLVDDREEALEEVRKEIKKAQEKSETLEANFEGSASRYPEVTSLAGIARNIERFERAKKELEEELDEDADDEEKEERDELKEEVETFKKEAENVIKKLNTDLNALNKHLLEAEKQLEKAKDLNEEAAKLINENQGKDDYNNAQAAQGMAEGQSVDASASADGLNGALEALEELILEDEYFTNVEEPLEQAIYLTLTDRGGDALDKFLQEKLKQVENDSLEQGLLAALHVNTIDRKIGDFSQAKGYMDDVITATNNIPELKEEDGVEEKEKEAETEFNKAKQQIEEFTGVVVDFNNYTELKSREGKYIEFAESEAEQKELDTESKEDLADSSMDIVDMIFGSIGDVLINARDRAYINEYIMMRFNHHKFTSRGAGVAGSTESEIEYILYGMATPQLNVGAALSELFAFRFAVNFIEAFSDPIVRKSGKFILLFATAYALIETAKDMNDIFNDEKFDFIDMGPEYLTGYSDYLRLFLFVHPNGNKMQRTLARIDHKTGNDLTEMPTYIEGEVEVTVDLWFLPGVADMLGNLGVLQGHVDNGEFRIRKKAVYSY